MFRMRFFLSSQSCIPARELRPVAELLGAASGLVEFALYIV